MKLPKEMKMTFHAQQRLNERKDENTKYNIRNLMRSSVKWYGKDDLIHDCALYRHCCYTTRKSSQMGYITDGDIEVIYSKNTHTAITVLEVKDKFKPITQFIKPEILDQIKTKKEKKKMEAEKKPISICSDCGKEEEVNHDGMCARCVRRKLNFNARGKEYVRYIDLSEKEKAKVDRAVIAHTKPIEEKKEEPIILEAPNSINYYSSKANQTEVETHPMIAPVKIEKAIDPLSDEFSFIQTLKSCNCDIPEEDLKNVLNVLMNTDKLKDILMTIAKNNNQQTILHLEELLGTAEKKLQHDWECNGFQELDDIRFKGFLTWRRVLKEAIAFWKQLYQTNAIEEIQKIWNTCVQNSIESSPVKEEPNPVLKKYQITTETISTILNTRRPFTRVFYAKSEDDAQYQFTNWLADRQLHECKTKTTIVELKE